MIKYFFSIFSYDNGEILNDEETSRKSKIMSSKIKSSFTFGSPIAETDHLLSESYYDNGDFEAIESNDDRRCFIIGRTGSGKTAAFQRLDELYQEKVVRIDPESLSLPYILNIDIIHHLLKLNVHLEPFMVSLWKHVIVVELLRHRYKIDSPEKKRNVMQSLLERLKRDPGKLKAVEYLDKFGDRFWCETDERIKQIADTFVKKVGAASEISSNLPSINVKGSGSIENTITQEVKQEMSAKYQRVVNEMQLPHLNQMLTILNNEILDSSQHFTYLIIDDLDKQWIDEDLAILLIKCLFQAVVDMQKVKYLKILVALRTNIFNQLSYGKQARGGQEEKFRGLSLDLRWNSNDLKSLLERRAKIASDYYHIDPPKSLLEILPSMKSKRANNPINYIIDHTLMRPRDAILFLNRCVREAPGKDRLVWENIQRAEKAYSQDRLLALRDEWKDPYIGIEKVLDSFKNHSARLSRDAITSILDDIALLLADRDFPGGNWLNELCKYIYEGIGDWNKMYHPLVNFFYSISFLGIVKGATGKARYAYEDLGFEYITEELTINTYFEIHPTFQQALHLKGGLIKAL